MKIDHIGYAVENIEKTRESMESLGYSFDTTLEDRERNIQLAFGEFDGYRIELVSPLGGSPVDSVLSKNGPTPYHICYRSSNLDEDMRKLREERFRVVIPPSSPAVAFGGRRVVFLYSLNVGLMEIVED